MKAFVALVCLVVVVVAQTTTTQEPSTQPPVNCDVSLDDKDWALVVPNPVDCESYYICDGGIPILKPCPNGLHFNPKLSVCDWPETADCVIN